MTVSELRALVDNLDEYIHIPGGIDRLKKMVLHLAVSGQLVPQDPSEGTGEELYRKIQTEKAELIKQGRIKKQKALHEIGDDEVPFAIPNNWKWARLGDVTNYGSSDKAKPVSIGAATWILELEDIEKTTSNLLAEVYGDERKPSSDKNIFYKNDVLYGKLRPYLDKVIVAHIDGVCSSEILPLRSPGNYIDPSYLRFVLKSPYFLDYVNELTYGVKMPRLGTDDGRNALMALAPHSEQKRIVAKIVSIFALIDQLEEVYKSEQAERSKLVASSLAQLAKGEVGASDCLALAHLSEIIRTKADAKILRQSILHLAVSGQLTPQDPSEGTGEELYRQIQAKKAELVKQGKLKKQKVLPEISDDEVPFAIPSSWRWARLAESYDVRDGTHDTPKYTTTGYPLITSKNLSSGKLDFSNVKYISHSDYMAINERSDVKRNDILFAMIGSIGNPVAVDTDTEFSIKNVALFKPYSKEAYSKDWLLNYLLIASEDMKSRSSGAVQSFVSLGFLRSYPIPLPPLAEQKRIVTKTTQLLNLVSELETHLEKQ